MAAALSDDAIVEATLERGEQTPFERAGLAVIRMCIAFREAPAGDADYWLDRIGLALGKFEPIFETRERQREHGKASGIARDPLARHPELVRRIRKMLKDGENPRQYVKRWAAEGGVSKSTLYQLIRRLQAE